MWLRKPEGGARVYGEGTHLLNLVEAQSWLFLGGGGIGEGPYEFPRATIAKYHQLGGTQNKSNIWCPRAVAGSPKSGCAR